jgi:ABC-type transport system substrate-binding protein
VEVVMRVLLAVVSLALILTTGCTPAGTTQLSSPMTQQPHGPKRIVMAFNAEKDLAHHVGMSRPILRTLVNPGLSVVDDHDVRRPTLAEAVPTLENGRWKAFPDGRMETTWTIRAGARWHDGAPFTTDDLLFTAAVSRDPEVTILNNQA